MAIKIKIICIGKIKEKYLNLGIDEYLKRLTSYAKVEIIELAETKLNEESDALIKQVINDEGQKIINKLSQDSYKIALSPQGKNISNEKYVTMIEEAMLKGKSEINFIIGGSYGLSEAVIKQCDFIWSFSQLVFTHQMIRLMLLEQIYRGFKIMKNEPYHK